MALFLFFATDLKEPRDTKFPLRFSKLCQEKRTCTEVIIFFGTLLEESVILGVPKRTERRDVKKERKNSPKIQSKNATEKVRRDKE